LGPRRADRGGGPRRSALAPRGARAARVMRRAALAIVLSCVLGANGCVWGARKMHIPAPAPAAPPPSGDPVLASRVRDEARFAWDAYARHAWGHDELRPRSKGPHDWYASPLLITPVDALDTLILLGLDDE